MSFRLSWRDLTTAIALLSFVCLSGFGGPSPFLELERSLEERLRIYLQSIDKEITVAVEITPSTRSPIQLPTTPFVLDPIQLSDDVSSLIEKIKVRLITHLPEVPSEYLDIIKQACVRLGHQPEISLHSISSEQTPVDTAPQVLIAPPAVDPFLWRAVLVAGMLLGLALYFFSSTRVVSLLKEGVDTLSTRSVLEGASHSEKAPALDISSALWHLPEEGLEALISDCYWGEFDSYALFLWKRIALPQRKALLNSLEYLAEYVDFFSKIPHEEDLQAVDEPYYLSPLPISLIDNRDLTKEVKKHPSLLRALSTLRVRSLDLAGREKIQFNKQAIGSRKEAYFKVANLKPSNPRSLKNRIRIYVNSVEEEEEILSLPFDLENVESVPSLGWLVLLPNESIQSILGSFTPKELAFAWVGPESALKSLSKTLPAKTRDLLASYTRQIVPSRHSLVFRQIHDRTVAVFKEQRKNLEADSGYEKAA